ncbi:GNAT family N-acetyltransferase [Succinatimonas hippei]|uniref:GNAT family N-acetyltransferase n=1 Tax=Succinatimonas hippei TaxID=626938 RepID=UPI002010F8BD|nr:GNAT family N-acetyltransferase [Succinatimonas hippei]MCL1603489.1 GNAT family N-acetyltransferase [Succinatimonas hippei]
MDVKLDDLNLVKASVDDAEKIAQIISSVSEGMLEFMFANFAKACGLNGVNELLTLILRDEKGIFTLDHFILIKFKHDVVGLAFAYLQQLHQDLLPDFVIKGLTENEKELINEILPFAKNSLYLNTLYVRDDIQNCGLGKLLLTLVKDKAIEKQCSSVRLHVFNDNKKALSFYKKYGFKEIHQCSYPEGFLLKHPQGGTIMELNLGGAV